ncbi:UNVERIFIED_CONTAM: hypothetical protein PYX00_002835 [Menopon gallinae]|uniref:Uncharacterized protein n=1 Tax=Menopon gallinae TaxID=328185 RepID=A0AAW2HYV2_9NEOP
MFSYFFSAVLLIALGLLGTTAGAHRLWAHRSYSANLILRIILMLCQTLVGYSCIYDWVLDHRIHHKYHGTDDDPFNYKRGFVYAQIGTYMLSKNPRRQEIIKEIDMSDLEQDKVVMFQKRFFWVLMPILNLLLTINAPAEYWGEDLLVSFMVIMCLRIPVAFHASWLVNSARTIWGMVPNDRFFSDSNLAFIIKKSHWHEYHYTIPWDCLTNEFGSYNCGCSTIFIKIWAAMGWAYNLKTIDARGIRQGLTKSANTGKPVVECLNEVAEEMMQYQPEDKFVDLLRVTK